MALQSSGQIKLSEIAAEFGGSAPHALSEYHGQGNAPASGEIQLAADFYGTSSSLAQFTITVGKRTIKPTGGGNFDFGFVIPGSNGTGASTGFGSITSGSNSFGGRTCVAVYINQDNALTNTMDLNVTFNTQSPFTGWTSVTVGTTTRNRTQFTGGVINGTAYRYNIQLGAANTTNPLPEGSSRTITFN